MDITKVSTTKGGKTSTKWFYNYKDSSNKKHTRICKNCNSYDEAVAFVSKIQINKDEQYLIKNIAKDMFKIESNHLKRMEQFGKTFSEETRYQKRQFIQLIIEKFGDEYLNKLSVKEIEKYLLEEHKNHSGSWKNTYLETFGAIYDETIWSCSNPIQKPKFQKFARNSIKADIFTTEELNQLFNPEIWEDYREYLLFYISATCGLRLGEARGLQVNQFMLKDQVLLVNGFCKKNGIKTNYCKKATNDDKKFRYVPIPNDTVWKIANYISKTKKCNEDYLFLTDDNFIYTQDHLEKLFKKMLLKSKIIIGNRKLVPHSLRFTYVTRMRRTLSAEDVRKIVGHNSIVMTEYYTRPNLPDIISTIEKAIPVANEIFMN